MTIVCPVIALAEVDCSNVQQISERMNMLHTIKRRKPNRTRHTLRTESLLKHVTEVTTAETVKQEGKDGSYWMTFRKGDDGSYKGKH